MAHRGTGQTRSSQKQAESDEIERLTAEYLEQGGEIQKEDLRVTRQVDLTWRNYSQTAMEGVE